MLDRLTQTNVTVPQPTHFIGHQPVNESVSGADLSADSCRVESDVPKVLCQRAERIVSRDCNSHSSSPNSSRFLYSSFGMVEITIDECVDRLVIMNWDVSC